MNQELDTEDDLACACGTLVVGPLIGMILWAALWAVI